jgi:hypothetical protein
MRTCRLFLSGLFLLGTTKALAQGQVNHGPSAKQAVARRLTSSIAVDGRLDDAAWAAAPFFDDFQMKEPIQFGPPGDRTEIAFLYDEHALYIGVRAHSSNPDAIPRAITRRDQYGNSEHVVISLDPYLDRRTAYSFSVTAGGVRRDYYHAQDSEHDGRDFTYDPVWEGRSAVDSAGWTAEMRIPFSQLRFNDRPVQVWGLNINRWIPQRNEDNYWVVVPRDQAGYVSRFGTLTGIEQIEPRGQIELLPYAAAHANHRSRPEADNPFDQSWNSSGRLGADLKASLGPSLTLNATINPDFGQVEADPAELNLSAFETIFDERRPFFTQGRQYIEGRVGNYFYSRRIGGQPRGRADGDFVDTPDNTTILGAAKITGRTPSGLQVGALAAVTDREFADVYHTVPDQFDRQEVEPTSLYGVLRLQQQFGASQSVAGFSFAGLQRYFDDASPLRERFTSRALAGGLDYVLRFQGGRYELSGHAGLSRIEGDTAALNRIQRSSAHYFQRPDREIERYDPTRTSLTGYTISVRGDKNAGNWLWGIQANTESPEFETNDMGRLQSGDDLELSGDINYRMTDPGRVFRSWRLGVFAQTAWNYDWDRGETRVELFGNGQFANYLEADLELYHTLRSQSDHLTRGGPLMGTGRNAGVELRVNSNFAAPTQWSIEGEYAAGEYGALLRSLEAELQVRPSPKWSLSINPEWFRYNDPRQYVTTVEGGGPETFGNRYIFATVDQSVLSVQFRFNYTFTPDLTLETYAEPFTASGHYSEYGELPAPGRRDLRLYGTDGTTIAESGDQFLDVTDSRYGGSFQLPREDFNLFSLRTNAVLRWEWRRGSTLYLVWQQNRSASCDFFADPADCPTGRPPGSLSKPGFLGDVFGIPGDNFLAIKVSYWIPLR